MDKEHLQSEIIKLREDNKDLMYKLDIVMKEK
jgi:hypothetical protein